MDYWDEKEPVSNREILKIFISGILVGSLAMSFLLLRKVVPPVGAIISNVDNPITDHH